MTIAMITCILLLISLSIFIGLYFAEQKALNAVLSVFNPECVEKLCDGLDYDTKRAVFGVLKQMLIEMKRRLENGQKT